MRVILSILFCCYTIHASTQNWLPLDKGINFSFVGNHYIYTDQNKNDLYVYGSFFTSGAGDTLRGIAKWNGYSFEPLGKGVLGNPTCKSLASFKGKIYASGPWSLSASNPAFIASYDPSNQIWDTLYDAATSNDWLTVIDDKLIKSGFSDTCYGLPTSGVCSYDGTTWSSMLTLLDEGGGFHNMWSVVKYRDQIYVGGNFSLPDYLGNMIDDFAILENNSLYSFGGGYNNGAMGSIGELIVYKDELYISGDFTQSGGDPGNYIMRWDGQTLKDVGGGTDWYINDLLVYNGNLFAFGGFTYAGGIYAPRVAYWDGQIWHPMKGGEDFDNLQYITQATVLQDELYVVGLFDSLYNSKFNHVARYNHRLPGETDELEVFINNLDEEIIIQYEENNNYALAVGIFTPNGQQVGSYLFPNQQGYIHQSIPIPGLASGVYIVTAVAGDKKVSKKLLKI